MAYAANQKSPYANPQFSPYGTGGSGFPDYSQYDTSGYQPYSNALGQTYASGIPAGSVPFYGGNDLAQQFVNNRNLSQNFGDQMQSYFGGQGSQRAYLESTAGQKAAQLYGGLEQNPGYTQQEFDQMIGNYGGGPGASGGGNSYQDLLGGDYGSNYLSDDESSGIAGNPYGPSQAFDPSILNNGMNTYADSAAGNISGTQDRLDQMTRQYGSNLSDAINPGQLRQSSGYQQGMSNVYNNLAGQVDPQKLSMSGGYGNAVNSGIGQMNAAASNPGLNVNPGYQAGIGGYIGQMNNAAGNPAALQSQGYLGQSNGVYGATANNVSSAANNPNLQMSGEYARQAGMTDAEVEQTAALAGQSIGAQSRGQIQDLERSAAAEGNTNPLGIAAMRAQYGDAAAVQQADAVANARLQARGAQRAAATGVESTRLGANQYQTGQQIASGLALGQMGIGLSNTQEAMRLAAQEAASNRGMSAAQFGMGASTTGEQMRLGSAQDISSRQMEAAGYALGARTQEEAIRLGAQQYQTSAGINIGQYVGNSLTASEGQRIAAQQGLSGMQIGAANNLAGYGQANAMYGGNQTQQMQQNWLGANQAAGQYNQSNAYNAGLTAENSAANRAAYLAGNRQNVNMANQGNQFNRGFQVNSQLSGLQGAAAGQRIAGQNALRGYYTGQQGYQGQQQNQSQQNLLTSQNQTAGQRAAATQGSSAWELGNRNSPSLGGQFLQGLMGNFFKGIGGAAGGA